MNTALMRRGDLVSNALISILKKYLHSNYAALFSAVMTVVCCIGEIYLPFAMSCIVNEGIMHKNLPYIYRQGGLMLAAAFIIAVSGFLVNVACSFAGESFARDIRDELYEKINSMSLIRFESMGSGSLITRLTEDINACTAFLNIFIQLTVEPAVLLAGSIAVMWHLSTGFNTVFLIFLFIQVIAVFVFIYLTVPLFARVRAKTDKLNSYLLNSIKRIRLIKAFIGEKKEEEHFDKAVYDIKQAKLKAGKISALFNPMIMLIVNICICAILIISNAEFSLGKVNAGSVLAAVTYSEQILLSIIISGRLFNYAAEAKPSAMRITEILNIKNDMSDGNTPLKKGKKEIELRQASFSYPNGINIFKNIDFKIQSGSFTALCGGTGSGKTTFARLLDRIYDVTEGAVLINGCDIRDFKIKDVRKCIAVVEKVCDIVEGSIAENIIYGREYVMPDDMEKALKAAELYETVYNLENKEFTYISSMGTTLSGGEKQRLAIARALAGAPDVLVIDDGTSSLDYASEGKIIQNIRNLYPDLTVLITTQRVLDIQWADKVACIEKDGKISYGILSELAAKSPAFSVLYASQEVRL